MMGFSLVGVGGTNWEVNRKGVLESEIYRERAERVAIRWNLTRCWLGSIDVSLQASIGMTEQISEWQNATIQAPRLSQVIFQCLNSLTRLTWLTLLTKASVHHD